MEDIISFGGNKTVLVTPEKTEIDYVRHPGYKRIGMCSLAQVDALAQLAPSAIAAKEASSLYRVVYPQGVIGTLVEHNGGYLSVMRNETGIVGHATYVPLQQTDALALGAFSAMSVVTGQYYMHRLNQQMAEVQSKLDAVLDFLYDEKSCELYANAKTVNGIYENYSTIVNNAGHRAAALAAIQQAKTVSEKNVQFYYRDMNKTADQINPSKLEQRIINSLRDILGNYAQSINLYGICSILEIFLSQNFSKSFMTFIEKDLKQHIEIHNKVLSKLEGKLGEMINAASRPTIPVIGGKPDTELMQKLLSEVQSLIGEESPVKTFEPVIREVIKTFSEKTEFHILKDGTIYQKQ